MSETQRCTKINGVWKSVSYAFAGEGSPLDDFVEADQEFLVDKGQWILSKRGKSNKKSGAQRRKDRKLARMMKRAREI